MEKKCDCGTEIHPVRIKLGYKACLQCSTESKKAAVDIVFHKTGNTLEIVDEAKAKKINKLAKRSGFGIMSGIRGSKTNTYSPKNISFGASSTFVSDEFNIVREYLLDWCTYLDYDTIFKRLQKYKSERRLSNKSYESLMVILSIAFNINDKDVKHKETKEEIDPEIEYSFKNWRYGK